MEKIFAIGDIHGCLDKLSDLLEKIQTDEDYEQSTLVFMGDYIDRGPKSYGVVNRLIELKDEHPDIIFLKGNHEDMLEGYLYSPDKYTYLINGGQQTLDSYLEESSPGSQPIPDEHLEFFSSLLTFYETENYIFVHAGLKEHIPLIDQDIDDMLWIRSEFIQSEWDFGKQIIFGHTPFLEPLIMPNKIGIDTGAVYGHKLTCVKLPDVEFFFAS